VTNTLTGTVRGSGPWTIQWNDGTIQPVATAVPGPVSFSRDVVATNPSPSQTVTTSYYVTSLVDAKCLAIPAIDVAGTNSIIVYPTPTVTAVAAQGPYCNTSAGAAISFSGPVTGTTFSWASTANVGFGTSGAGNIGAFTAVNGGTAPVVATVIVTPSANGCVGTPSTFTLTVNPTPNITAASPSSQTNLLGSGMTQPIDITGTFTAITWTNDNPGIGLAASGSGNDLTGSFQIMPFTPTNSGTATITITPYYTNSLAGGPNCQGAPTNVTITVINPAVVYFTIQVSGSTNVVLEWFAYTNTALLSATNLTLPISSWSTNGVFTVGTNRVTNSILFNAPNEFYRLTTP